MSPYTLKTYKDHRASQQHKLTMKTYLMKKNSQMQHTTKTEQKENN